MIVRARHNELTLFPLPDMAAVMAMYFLPTDFFYRYVHITRIALIGAASSPD